MSKQSEAKAAQGYTTDPRNCGNCGRRTFDLETPAWLIREGISHANPGWLVEKNQRCGIGGFAIKKTARCDKWVPKAA